MNTIYQFIKPFLDNKMSIFEEYGTVSPHYENTPIQIQKISSPKPENHQIKNSDIFHISVQNIDCGYSLEPPRVPTIYVLGQK